MIGSGTQTRVVLDAPGASARSTGHRFVAAALLRREDFGDAIARFRAQSIHLPPPLRCVLRRRVSHLRAVLGEDRLDARTLLGREREFSRQPLRLRGTAPLAFRLGFSTVAVGRNRLALGHARRRTIGRSGAHGTETQRRVRHLQHAFAALGDHTHVRGHAGKEREILVRRADHGDVRDDVLNHLRGFAQLRHVAAEHAARESVDRERCLLPELDAPDLGLVDRGVDLHAAQVLRDDEKLRRLQARRDGLAGLHGFLDDNAVDGRADLGTVEIDPGLSDLGFTLLHDGFGVSHLRLRDGELRLLGIQLLARCVEVRPPLVEHGFGDEVLLEETLAALKLALRIGEQHFRPRDFRLTRGHVRSLRQCGRPRRVQIRHRRIHAKLERLRIDPRDQLPVLHRRVEVGVKLLDLPRDLGTHLNGHDGIQRSCRGHGCGDRAALDLGEPVRRRRGERIFPPDIGPHGRGEHDDNSKHVQGAARHASGPARKCADSNGGSPGAPSRQWRLSRTAARAAQRAGHHPRETRNRRASLGKSGQTRFRRF